MSWYIGRDGERRGPFDEQTLMAMVARGDVRPDDLVWHSGDAGWRAAREVPGLFLPPPLETDAPPHTDARAEAYSPATAVPEPHAAVASPSPRRNYLRRHWDGDLSLPITYWVNGVGSTMLVIGLGALATGLDWTDAPRMSAGVVALVIAFAMVATVWQLVGVWRSADKHVGRGGLQVWATLAKVAVVMGVLRTGVDLSETTIPQLGGLLEIVRGDPQHSGYELRVLRDASELEVAGPIGFGLSDEVQKILDAHPTITLVHLNSNGGRVEEAKKLAGLITARGLSTYSSGGCASACTIAFMGGERRLLRPGASLGFHSFDFPGMSALELASAHREAIEFLVARGVTRAFAERAFDTPSSSMWYPTAQELIAAGVVTAEARPDEVALSGIAPAKLAGMEQELLQFDLFTALKEFEPETYTTVMTALRDGMQRGRTQLEVRQEVMPQVQKIYLAKLPYASDEAVLAISELMLDEMVELRQKSGELCRDLLSEDVRRSAVAAGELSAAIRAREMTVAGAVIRTAASGAYGPRPGARFDAQIEQIVGELAESWGEDVALLGEMDNPAADATKVCDVTMALFQALLKRPPAEAAQLLRTMYAG